MDRGLIEELHFMTAVNNLPSILEDGILCFRLAEGVPHESVADWSVQDIRAGKRVPQASLLHDYANLYFDARNAMMFRRRTDDLIVIRVDPSVLDIEGAVITDGNAANGPTRFFRSPDGLAHLDPDRVFAVSWNVADPFEKAERKRQRQAEVLIPERVPPDYIFGCYARVQRTARQCHESTGIPTEVNKNVYFE